MHKIMRLFDRPATATTLPLLLCITLLNGCASTNHGHWGAEATLTPGWVRIQNAAYRAATHPMTWGPALGAAVFSIGDFDEETSEWAVDETPLFGSDANDASDDLRTVTTVAYALTALAAPSGDDAGTWTVNKAQGLAVGLAAFGLVEGTTDLLKDATGRERPNGDDNQSMPSKHASQATSRAALAVRNLDYIAMPNWSRTGLTIGLYGIAGATAWARVEAEQHYPSDVLAGMALGNFLALFINDAFLGTGQDGPIVNAYTSHDGFEVQVVQPF